MAQMMLTAYTQQKENIKRALRPNGAGLKTGLPSTKIRSYAPRQWVYR